MSTPLRMIALLKPVISVVTLLAVSGCIPVHLGDDMPFRPEKIGFIQAGKTTVQEMEEYLGQPFEMSREHRWWVYSSGQKATEFLLLFTGLADDTIGGRVTPHYLVVEFDDNRVVRQAIVLEGDDPCDTQARVCYSDGFLEHLVAGAKTANEVPNEHCAVILYSSKPQSPFTPVWVSIDDRPTRSRFLSNNGYLRLDLEAGKYELTARSDLLSGLHSESIDLNCEPRSTYFFRFTHDEAESASFKLVANDLGLEEIGKRKRIVPFALQRIPP